MNDAQMTFEQARTRLDEIVSQVRKKDVSLESCLDLLEEGVRLANICTERIDHSQWNKEQEDNSEEGSVEAAAEGSVETAADDGEGSAVG